MQWMDENKFQESQSTEYSMLQKTKGQIYDV